MDEGQYRVSSGDSRRRAVFSCSDSLWFAQSATFGEFQKKKRKNATSPAIFEEFMKQRKNRVSDVIAYYVSGKAYKAGEFEQPKVVSLTGCLIHWLPHSLFVSFIGFLAD